MKTNIRLIFALALVCAAMSTAALASENAYLYLVQGIPGLDYSTSTDPQFPVDVLINDEVCAEHNLAFGTIIGPLTFAPGSYDIKISVANTLAPCSETPLVDSSVTLSGGENMSAVLTLNSTEAPALETFKNLFSPVTAGYARISFALAADSSAVQVVFQNTSTKQMYTYTANPGVLLNESLPAGDYTVTVTQGTTTLVASLPLTLYSQSVEMLIATGEASNNTVTLQTKTVRNVI
jgi:hypothetical protein